MRPVVALVGRPNVGKSTLFNRLTRSRAALVADEPGLTRDRQYGDGVVGDRPYLVVDTGGLVENFSADGRAALSLTERVLRQTRQALNEADAVIFLVDGREGPNALDQEIAGYLRRLGKAVTLAVNKVEGMEPDSAVAEFHAFGLGQPYPISSAHGRGIAELMEHALARLPRVAEEPPPTDVPRVAVIGRPNVGKSTLVNALLGEERVIVSDQPGTTRDSIHLALERGSNKYVLIDTAGVRKRARVHESIEKFSVIKTLQAVDEANVVILVVDAHAGVAEQDADLGGYAVTRGRSVVLAVNKWDAVDTGERAWAQRELERKLSFLDFAPVHYISALTGAGLAGLFPSVDRAFASAQRELPTPRLTRVLQRAIAATPPPVVRGRRIRLKFAHQGGKNPPVVVIHGNQTRSLPASYQRYLANTFRKAFQLIGTPVRIECREGENPYRDKHPARASTPTRRRRSVRKRVNK